MSALLNEISEALQRGRAPKVKELVTQALSEGIAPKDILEEGLLSGMAVIGERDGEELFLIVPADYDEEPYLAEWPFALSFKEMVSLLNGTVGETVISEEDYGASGSIQLYGIDCYLPDVDLSALDFLYMVYNPGSHYLLAQSGGEIVIYDTGTQQPYAPDTAAGPAA